MMQKVFTFTIREYGRKGKLLAERIKVDVQRRTEADAVRYMDAVNFRIDEKGRRVRLFEIEGMEAKDAPMPRCHLSTTIANVGQSNILQP